MRRRLIALGIISPLFLASICVVALLLTCIVFWLFSGQVEKSKIVQIIPLAPLTTKVALSPTAGSVLNQPTAPPAVEATPELATETESQPAVESEATLTSEEVEETLGFDLPAGSVNSINQQGVATRLVIPKLNLDSPILLAPIENLTWKVDHLEQAVGHLEGTAPPGSDSNLVLAGHVTLAAGVYGPFAGLAQLAPGDVIHVYSGQQMFQYVVDGSQTVDRAAVEVTYPSETAQLTLITCNKWNDEQGRYEQRLIVKGHLVEG